MIGIVMSPGQVSGDMPGSITIHMETRMFYPLFFFIGMAFGWYLRGTRAATWLYKWFKPDPSAVKETKD